MATEPQGNPGKPRFGPSDRLIAMFRLALRSRGVTHAVAILFARNLRITTLSEQVVLV